MFGEEKYPNIPEAAGSPKTTSLEVQGNQLYNIIDLTDNAVGRKAVTRIPTENGREVFIFNAPVYINEGVKHPSITHLGVSPTEGPILVTKGQLSVDLEEIQNAIKPESKENTWENLVRKSQAIGEIVVEGAKEKSEVRTILLEEQLIWNKALKDAVSKAKVQAETEQKLAQVLPQSLNEAMAIAASLNIPSELKTEPERRIPQEVPADHADRPNREFPSGDPRRDEARRIQQDTRQTLRPATPLPESPFGSQN